MFMLLSLETIFFIFLSITLAFDRCRHTENTDLEYVLKVDAFGFPSSSLDSCVSVCLSVCQIFIFRIYELLQAIDMKVHYISIRPTRVSRKLST